MEALESRSNQRSFARLVHKFKIDLVVVQHGKSPAPRIEFDSPEIVVKIADYFAPGAMSELLARAVVVIGHGGSGTAFEVLRSNLNDLEAFVMIENEDLADGHQAELIEALIGIGAPVIRGYLPNPFDVKGATSTEASVAATAASSVLPAPNMKPLTQLLDKYFSFTKC